MRFTVGDDTFDLELDDLTTAEADLVHQHTGLGLWAMGKGVVEGHPGAVRAVIFLAKRRAGLAVRWQDLDQVKIVPVAAAIAAGLFTDGRRDDADGGDSAGEPPDPTPATVIPDSGDGTTPASGSPTTSASSPPRSGGRRKSSEGSPSASSTSTPTGSTPSGGR